MIDLSKKKLPDSIFVDGKDYKIKTDFRLWLSFGRLLKERPTLSAFDFLYEYDGLTPLCPEDRQKGLDELVKFYNPKEPLPRVVGGSSEPVVDFEQDADLLFAAFFQFYGIRLTQAELHWHEFLALFRGLKDTKLNDVMGWRSFKPDTSKGMEKWNRQMNELKRAWALETEETRADQAALDAFNARFD